MSGYDNIEIKKSDKFLKIEAGETAVINIVTKDPKDKIIHIDNNKAVDCAGEACALCADGNKSMQRWEINVIDRSDGKTKSFSFGPSIARQITQYAVMLKNSGKTVHEMDMQINRQGAGLETKYAVLCVPSIPNKTSEVDAGTAQEPNEAEF